MDTFFIDDFSREVWETTYKHYSDKNIDDTFRRVAKTVASVEKTEQLKELWSNNFYELLCGFKATAGGRILANAGTDWSGTTLMNCFTGPKPSYDQDSIEGIFSVLKNQVLTLKSEGGWGMNFSFIRPRGSFIYGIGVETPGAVKYMELFNTSSDIITAGSGKNSKHAESKSKIKIRKGAMMGILDCWHPDVEEFITSKKQGDRLNKFNISVNCSNAFLERVRKIVLYQKRKEEAVSEDERSSYQALINGLEQWDLIFPDTQHPYYKEHWNGNIEAWKNAGYPVRVYKTIKVSYLWDLIMSSTYERNDPGVLFLDRANETHCFYYGGPKSHIAATNPCGEQCMPFGFVCNLASVNLTQFIANGIFDFIKLKKYIPWLVRFLDNVNDLTQSPLPEYSESIKKARRIGLGVMGWGSALYMLKIRFASKEAEILKEKIMKEIVFSAIRASIDLAKEKGMFEWCNPILHSKAPYFKQIGLDESLIKEIAEYGIRNSALFSCQPTGNTGVLANVVSGGIEPVFSPEYIRTAIVNKCPEELLQLVPKYWEGQFEETEVFKWRNEGSDRILYGEVNGTVYKIDKNRGLTKEVECLDFGVRYAVEKGFWNPKADWAVTASQLTVEEHVNDLKGFGKWIDSSISKTVNIPTDYPYDSFKELYLQAYTSGVLKGITTYRAGTMMNVLATKKSKNLISITSAPKRSTNMLGELHHFIIDGKKYYVAVGLFGDEQQPYEVFTGINETRKEIFIPKSVKKGQIIKKGRGQYVFLVEDGEEYELTNGHSNDTADALTRVISCSLRHGTDIAFIVHQLEKTKGPIISFSKALARTLKKYIKDGTIISGEECPECGKEMIRKEGCAVCKQCGYSKCS
jgi:ribonucleoside-diphosphate reductase alpha chain